MVGCFPRRRNRKRCGGKADQGLCRRRFQNPVGHIRFQGREVQEPGDSIHVQKMNFCWPTGQANGNNRCVRKKFVAFPRLQRECSEEVVVAYYDVRLAICREPDCVIQSGGAGALQAELIEKSGDMLAQIWMPSYAENSKCRD